MSKWKSYNCPKVKVGDLVRVIDITEGEEYENDYIDGTVFYTEDDSILLELDKNYSKVGTIEGWIADDFVKSEYGCKADRLYWWFFSWKKFKKRLEIE
jgi:hypothetical protein